MPLQAYFHSAISSFEKSSSKKEKIKGHWHAIKDISNIEDDSVSTIKFCAKIENLFEAKIYGKLMEYGPI